MMQQGEGVLEERTEKTTSNGNYLLLRVGKQSMSAWEEVAEEASKIPLKSHVAYTVDVVEKNGKTYHNLKTIVVALPPKDPEVNEERIGQKRVEGVVIGANRNLAASLLVACVSREELVKMGFEGRAQWIGKQLDALLEDQDQKGML
jgi:hypothetical protein